LEEVKGTFIENKKVQHSAFKNSLFYLSKVKKLDVSAINLVLRKAIDG
jgi:hypothetical protein